MSQTIDERVVSMQFDNKNFESNVSTSLSTLDKLKQSLNLTGAAKGLENIEAASRNVTMSGLGGAVETVRSKFSALEVMAITSLANITNSAVNAGKRLVSAFTIDPIKSGLSEYETQINAVQTIMANTSSKGTTLDQVNAALDTLNTYADKTIYNFTEMTRNIGTFTAAGVDLDTSVNAIQGIANLAAVSGSTSQQASTAMYQLSQALASGTVKLQDWNSVVNAGMGGQVFQDALKRTATNMGTDVDALITKYGSFRESLSQGAWLTTDVLTETLKQFAGAYSEAELIEQGYTEAQAKEIAQMAQTATDAATKVKTFTQLMDTLKEAAQSGWTQTWEILIGDFEEAKSLWTSVSDTLGQMISDSAQARNDMLQGWKDSGGRTMLVESLKNAFEGLMSVITPIKEAFRTIFPPITSEQLLKITERIRDLTAKFKLSDKQTALLKMTFKGLFSILDIGVSFIKAVAGGIGKLFGSFSGLGGSVLEITAKIGLFFLKLRNGIKSTDLFGKAIDSVVGFIQNGVSNITNIVKAVVSFTKELFSTIGTIASLINEYTGIGDKVSEVGSKIKDWFSGLTDGVADCTIFQTAIEKVTGFLDKASGKIKTFRESIDTKINSTGFETFLGVLQKVWDVIKNIGSKIGEVGSAIGKAFSNAFKSGDISAGLDVINGGLFVTLLLGIKKFIGNLSDAFDGAKGILDGVTGILDGVKGSLEAWQKDIQANTLLKIAGAIAILTAALVVLSLIDPDKLNTALGAITALFVDLAGSMAVFEKLDSAGKNASKAVVGMIGMSIAVLILASAMKKLSSLSWEELGKGIVGISALMGILVGFTALMSQIKPKKMVSSAVALILIGAAMEIFANVCKKFGAMDWETLGKSGAAIGGILLLAAGFAKLAGIAKKMFKSSVALILIGAAMEIFADVCKKFGAMKWEELGKAGAAIGGILVLAAGFAQLSGMAKKMFKSSVALILIGAAMEIFADVCNKFGSMKWEELGKAGAAIGGILVLASGFAQLSGMAKQMFKSSVALILIGAAMEIFADVCSKFGEMDWESLGKAGAAIGGILILAAGFALLAGLSSGMIASSIALLIMAAALNVMVPVLSALGGMEWSAIAKGLVAIAGVFVILGVAGLLLGPLVPVILSLSAAILLLGVGCLAVGAGIMLAAAGLGALATLGTAAAVAIVASLTIIISGLLGLIPVIVQRIGEAIIIFCDVIIEAAPKIAEAVKAVVLNLVDVLVECVPALANGALQLIVAVLTALVEYAPQIVDLVLQLLTEVFSAMTERMPEYIDTLANFVISIINGLAEKMPDIINAVINLLGSVVQGVADAIGPLVEQVIQPMLETIGSIVVEVIEALAPFIPNIQAMVVAVCDAVTSICGAFVTLLEQVAPIIDSISGLVQQLGASISQIFYSIAAVVTSCGFAISQIFYSLAAVISTCGSAISQIVSSIGDVINTVFTGICDVISTCAEAISTILTGLSDTFSTIFTGICDVVSTCSDSIVNILNGLATAFSTVFTGISDVITSIGDAIKSVLDGIADVITSIGDAALNAGTGFQNLANGIKTITDLSLVDMAASLAAVATGLGDIASKSGGLAEAGAGMQQISSGVTLSSDAFSTMASGIDSVTSKLSSIGSTASSAMSVVTSSVNSSASCFSTMSSAASSSVASIIASLSSVGTGVASFKSAISGLTGIVGSVMRGMASAVVSASGSMTSAISGMMSKMVSAVVSCKGKLTSVMMAIVSGMSRAVRSKQAEFASAGKTLGTRLASGLKGSSSAINSAARTMVSGASSAIRLQYSSFVSAGKYLGSGLVVGINAKKQDAYDAGYALGQKAVQGEKAGQQSNSPSKLTIKAGKWLGEGLVIGMEKTTKSVYNSGKDMGESAVSSISRAISNVSDLIDSGIDTQPTIRPILDLSAVESGANSIGGLFNASPSVGVLSNIRSISSMMNSNQNGANDDIISAIAELGRTMSGTSGDTYQINGITYDDGSNVSDAVKTLIRATRMERRT